MALSEFKHLYEILLRFDERGFKGAHAQYLEGVKRDDVIISATPGPAIPLTLVDDGDKPTVEAVVDEALGLAADAYEAMRLTIRELREALGAAEGARDALSGEVAELTAQLAEAARVATETDAALTAVTAERDAANAWIAALTAESIEPAPAP